MQNEQKSKEVEVVIPTDSGEIRLTPNIVRRYLVQGNGAVTDQEIMLFLALCKAHRLSPWVRDAYLVKYGNTPATIIVSKEAILKRAHAHPSFKGYKSGIIVVDNETKNITYTEGFCPPSATILGGWAEVEVAGWNHPLRIEININEYIARKADGTPTKFWEEKKCTMARKVALVQCLREAYPSLGGMYSEEEVPIQSDLPRTPVDASQVVDVSPEPKTPGSQDPVEPVTNDTPTEKEQRRRRHKFRVDPLIFGSDEILTCGCTAEQLMVLHDYVKKHPTIKSVILESVKAMTGYDQWSFMREDEAAEIIQRFSPYPLQEEQVIVDVNNAVPTDLVDCPVSGDRVSVGTFCKEHCKDRKANGWCPSVPCDEPIQAGEEML